MATTESEFWWALQDRISNECSRSSNLAVTHLVCDVLEPERYATDETKVNVSGKAYMLGHPTRRWNFTAAFSGAVLCDGAINWNVLLPENECDGWLQVDLAKHHISISREVGSRSNE